VPRVEAELELVAPREDVWAVISEPHRLRDWWPGITGLQPDRLGFAAGARWRVVGDNRPSFFRRPNMTGTLLVTGVEDQARFAFHLTGERIDAELLLRDGPPERTLARLTVNGPALIGLRRSLPRRALDRLYALCQTAADF
jgi:hypothetical protein